MIKTNSWHYKLANLGQQRVWPGDKIDFCSYARKVMIGAFGVFLIVTMLSGLGIWVLVALFEAIRWVFTGIPIDDPSIAMLMIIGALALGGAFAYFKVRQDEIRRENGYYEKLFMKKKEPGFFGMLYKKFKEKTCHLVEVEDYDE